MNNTAEKKKMEQAFALWRRKSKDGKKTYFTGKMGDTNLTAFYNTEKKNLKEPDMRVYVRNADGELSKEVYVSLWCNATKNGKKVLSGKVDGKRVVGFINANADEKHPYISVYWSDDQGFKKEEKKEAPKLEELGSGEELPF